MIKTSAVTVVIVSAVLGALAVAQEKVSIPSFTPTSPSNLLRHQAPAAAITGELSLPQGAGPFPALVLAAGSGGLGGPTGTNIRKWAHAFTGWGVATLVVDSFGPRGITETATNQGQLSTWADIADALSALKVLAANPRIDKSRIGIVGWSRGGIAAMDTALESVRRSVIDAPDLKFAAHVVFYGAAEVQYRDRATDGSPFLFFHGESDNYVPIAPTKEFSAWLESKGNPVTFVAYPKTFHDFDVEGGPAGFSRGVETSHNCDLIIDLSDGHVARMDHKDNPPVAAADTRPYLKSCAAKGADLAPNNTARADAVEKIHAFLVRYLRAKD